MFLHALSIGDYLPLAVAVAPILLGLIGYWLDRK